MNKNRTCHPNKHLTSIDPSNEINDENRLIDVAATFQELAVIYLRPGQPELPPEAIRDLEQYLDMLRRYYGIPDGQPVFPPRQRSPRTTSPEQVAPCKPSVDAKNSAGHPWRAA